MSLYRIPGDTDVTIGWDPRAHAFFLTAEPGPDNPDWVRVTDEPDLDELITLAEAYTYVPIHVAAQLRADQAHGCTQPDHNHGDHLHDHSTPALAVEETLADIVGAAAGLSAYAAALRKGNPDHAAFALRELNHAGRLGLVASILHSLISAALNNLSHATLATLTGRDICAVVVTGSNVMHIGIDHPDDLQHAEFDNHDPAAGLDRAFDLMGYPATDYSLHPLAAYPTHQVIYLRPRH